MLTGCMIGAGFFARIQMEAWQRIPEGTIAAVADLDADRLESFAAAFDVEETYTSAAELLQSGDWDFVDIVTRPGSHAELVRMAADAGIPVLCQKPFTRSLEEARRVVAYCQERDVPLMVNENWRWQPWYRELKRLLDAGRLGEPHHLRFLVRPGDGSGPKPYDHQPYFREMERFFIQESLVHQLDTARFLMGDVRQVYCRARRLNPAIAGEDFAVITLTFASGATGVIDANRYAGAEPSDVFGETALEGSAGTATVTSDGTIWLTDLEASRRRHPYDRPEWGYRGDSCRATQQHFIRCLTTGEPLETAGHRYLATLETVEATYRSAASRETVPLPLAGTEQPPDP